MIENGDTPLCVGIESGPATGWPFTDWTEEMILRNEGIDYYNEWVAHEAPFNDQPVVDAMAAGERPVGQRLTPFTRPVAPSPPRRSVTTPRRWSRASA